MGSKGNESKGNAKTIKHRESESHGICHSFLKTGKCEHGSHCKYLHVERASLTTGQDAPRLAQNIEKATTFSKELAAKIRSSVAFKTQQEIDKEANSTNPNKVGGKSKALGAGCEDPSAKSTRLPSCGKGSDARTADSNCRVDHSDSPTPNVDEIKANEAQPCDARGIGSKTERIRNRRVRTSHSSDSSWSSQTSASSCFTNQRLMDSRDDGLPANTEEEYELSLHLDEPSKFSSRECASREELVKADDGGRCDPNSKANLAHGTRTRHADSPPSPKAYKAYCSTPKSAVREGDSYSNVDHPKLLRKQLCEARSKLVAPAEILNRIGLSFHHLSPSTVEMVRRYGLEQGDETALDFMCNGIRDEHSHMISRC